MTYRCYIGEALLSAVILAALFWPSAWQGWIIGVCAVLLLVHALACKSCRACEVPVAKSSAKGKAKRR